MYIYICMCTYIGIVIYIYTHSHICMYTHSHAHTWIHTRVYIYTVCICTHAHTRTHTHTHKYSLTPTPINICIVRSRTGDWQVRRLCVSDRYNCVHIQCTYVYAHTHTLAYVFQTRELGSCDSCVQCDCVSAIDMIVSVRCTSVSVCRVRCSVL